MAEEVQETHLLEQDPPILRRIYAIRDALVKGGTDRDDHVEETVEWEVKAKQALIKLQLKGHEGVKMILENAVNERRIINSELKNAYPKSMSQADLMEYAIGNALLIERKKMWDSFIEMFNAAEEDIAALETELEQQEEEFGLVNEEGEDEPSSPTDDY